MLNWNDDDFRKEVRKLREGLLSFCLFWGLIFGGSDVERDNKDEEIAAAISFTFREFPKRHHEVGFDAVVNTLLHVATVYENGHFFVRPEINTIYAYYTFSGKEGKHDRITPVIKALADDCLWYAKILQGGRVKN